MIVKLTMTVHYISHRFCEWCWFAIKLSQKSGGMTPIKRLMTRKQGTEYTISYQFKTGDVARNRFCAETGNGYSKFYKPYFRATWTLNESFRWVTRATLPLNNMYAVLLISRMMIPINRMDVQGVINGTTLTGQSKEFIRKADKYDLTMAKR